MTNLNTKRTLLSSIIALLICITMLLGTTFAWFTDSATSAGNVIQTGTLDVQLLMYNGTDYVDISESDKAIFGEGGLINEWEPDTDMLWEPGKTQIVYLAIKNDGDLSLKYNILIDITDNNLIGALEYAIIDGATNADAQALGIASWGDITATDDVQTGLIAAGRTIAAENGKLQPEGYDYFALAVHMSESAGNEYKNKDITLDISVVATQLASEEDSFGPDYDAAAPLDFTPVATEAQFQAAIANEIENIVLVDDIVVTESYDIDYDANIDGAGYTIERKSTSPLTRGAESVYTGAVFTVKAGSTLVLEDIVVDGGAIWAGEINPCLLRGTENIGVTATGALVAVEGNGVVILNEGAILQNNDGANAVGLSTRAGSKLIINGGEILNNHAAAGAIWGGGEIILNSGKVNGNHGGIGGAIRSVTNVGTVLTMNGGQMNHNYSDDNGGAIWAGSSPSNNVYVLNGGEMAYNYAAGTGGAIYAGHYETVKIGGTFKMHDNACAANIGSAIRFHDHASLIMTGGEIYNHADDAFFLYNNSASITGGKYVGNFGYSGGLGLTIGEAEIDGVIYYNLGTNHNTAYLAAEFGTLKFTVNESAANFAQFNFKPAADYTYTEGDEAKLICMNEGYETYWDSASSSFKLQAAN